MLEPLSSIDLTALSPLLYLALGLMYLLAGRALHRAALFVLGGGLVALYVYNSVAASVTLSVLAFLGGGLLSLAVESIAVMAIGGGLMFLAAITLLFEPLTALAAGVLGAFVAVAFYRKLILPISALVGALLSHFALINLTGWGQEAFAADGFFAYLRAVRQSVRETPSLDQLVTQDLAPLIALFVLGCVVQYSQRAVAHRTHPAPVDDGQAREAPAQRSPEAPRRRYVLPLVIGGLLLGASGLYLHQNPPQALIERGAAVFDGIDLESVEGIQRALQATRFYFGPIDGEWSQEVEFALMRFQSANDIEADGIIGPETKTALRRALRAEENS